MRYFLRVHLVVKSCYNNFIACNSIKSNKYDCDKSLNFITRSISLKYTVMYICFNKSLDDFKFSYIKKNAVCVLLFTLQKELNILFCCPRGPDKKKFVSKN